MTRTQLNMLIFIVLALGVPCLVTVGRIVAPLFR
jgi:hypothetical protein